MNDRLIFHFGAEGLGLQHRPTCQEFGIGVREVSRRRGAGKVALDDPQPTEACVAEAHRFVYDRIEYRCKIARRGVDKLHNLGGRGLLRN